MYPFALNVIKRVAIIHCFLLSAASWSGAQNMPPTADAGEDQIEVVGSHVVLSSQSSDPEGQALEHEWSMISQPLESEATLIDPGSGQPSFFADQVGSYVVRLRVSDGIFVSDYDDIVVRVVTNSRPIALVNADQSLRPGETALLDASGSFDLEHAELQFRWVDRFGPG